MSITKNTPSLEVDNWINQSFTPAMEMTASERIAIIQGRKEFFNLFYERVCAGMRARGNQLLRHIASYRDKNIETLSSPYLLGYTIFGAEDRKVIFNVCGIPEDEVDAAIKGLKQDIKQGCIANNYKVPASLFENVESFRVILLLMMRYYMERGEKSKMEQLCAYAGYSMFYTLFYNSFPNGVRKETMVYTITSMSKKHIIRKLESVDSMLTYGIKLCVDTYRQRIMDCTDDDIVYIIGQWKSRLRGYIVGIAKVYYDNDEQKNAIFTSSERAETEDGTDFVERASKSGSVDKLATQYSQRFFQKPLDEQIIAMTSQFNSVARLEIKNALTSLRADRGRIAEVKSFYQSLFYLYLQDAGQDEVDVNTKKFLATMNAYYKKGNSKETNITTVKDMLDRWLKATSVSYKEANSPSTINNFKKALFQYFVFVVALRQN